jgi:hypothetical protein
MKKSEVKIGGVYIAKVTNKLVQVRIDAVSKYGGWTATNLLTSKTIRVRSATRLRSEVGNDAPHKKTKSTQCNKPVTTAIPSEKPAEDPKPVSPACANCGSTEVDDDGDCAKCHEPKAADTEPQKDNLAKPTAAKPGRLKRLSGLDAAVKVLEDTGVAMNVKEIVEVAFAKGYWKPAGRTPSATLAAALIREIAKKGSQSRFRKTERGKFVLNR